LAANRGVGHQWILANSWEKIVRLFGENGNMTAETLSETIGITNQALETENPETFIPRALISA